MTSTKRCKEQGYHHWSIPDMTVESIGESFEDMTLTAKCSLCNATWEAEGYWEVD